VVEVVVEVEVEVEVVDSFHVMIGEEEKVANNLRRIQDNHPAHYPI
jgi:hypothetical protein